MSEGFVRVPRRYMQTIAFKEKRPHTKEEAFLDICSAVRYSSSTDTVYVNGKYIEVHQNEWVASLNFLKERWGWARGRVERYMKLLEHLGYIERQPRQGENVLTLLDKGIRGDNRTTDETAIETRARQRSDSGETNKKKVKEEAKKGKKDTSVQTQKAEPCWSRTDGWQNISDEYKSELLIAYPACDINRQLQVMHLWLTANPSKAQKKQWKRFIQNWLGREQERGGDISSNKINERHRQNPGYNRAQDEARPIQGGFGGSFEG